jgi:hypothetical protein
MHAIDIAIGSSKADQILSESPTMATSKQAQQRGKVEIGMQLQGLQP